MDFDFMNAMTQQEDPVQDPTPVTDCGTLSDGEGLGEEPVSVPNSEGLGDAENTELQQQEPKPQQSAEENARYAAARRRAEQEMQRLKQELEILRRENESFKASTQRLAKRQQFDSFDDLLKACDNEDNQRLRESLKNTGVEPQLIEQFIANGINNDPRIVAFEKMQKKQEQDDARARIAAGRKALDDAVAEIGKLDDRIKSFEDLPKMDNYEQFDDLVRNKHYGMVDAYKLCNMDRLQEKRAAVVRQETRNSINSRSHLKQTGGGAVGSASVVPADVKAMYKQFNPNATDAQILAHWQKSQKE